MHSDIEGWPPWATYDCSLAWEGLIYGYVIKLCQNVHLNLFNFVFVHQVTKLCKPAIKNTKFFWLAITGLI